MVNKITTKTISNITKVDWISFFKENSVKGFTPHLSPASYEPLTRYLNQEDFIDVRGRKELIDNFIFHNIALEKSNIHYLFEFKDIDLKFDNHEILINHFENDRFESLNFDKSFFSDDRSGQTRIFTSRLFYNDNILENLIILLKVGETTDDSPKNFFVTINIDFVNNFYNINFSKNSLRFVDANVASLMNTVTDFLESNVFSLFNIESKMPNEYTLNRALFNLYSELSDDIEDRLENFLPDNFEEITSRFLDEISVEVSEKYLKQIKAILFQDRAGLDNAALYPDGWITRFLFQDGDSTRASSRTDQHDPIYTSPIYWNLKELIRAANALIDVGFVWKTSLSGEDVNIYVRLDVINENICLHYYQKGNYNNLKREKENYVRKKIRGVLPQN